MTAFVDIEAAVVATLSSGTPVATRIQRGRMRPLPEEVATAVAVRIEGGENERPNYSGDQLWRTELVIECQARAAAAQAPSVAVDTLLAAMNARIAADPTLGAVVMDCYFTGFESEIDDTGDYAVISLLTRWTVLHQTDRATLT